MALSERLLRVIVAEICLKSRRLRRICLERVYLEKSLLLRCLPLGKKKTFTIRTSCGSDMRVGAGEDLRFPVSSLRQHASGAPNAHIVCSESSATAL